MATVTEKFAALRSDVTDPRTRRYLVPKRVVLTEGDVNNAEGLLIEKSNQITLDTGTSACTLTNKPGQKHARVVVDFGIEFSGSLRVMIWSVNSPGDRADINVRFGESVMEAITPIGEKNTTNDHAIRDRVMNVGMMSACETNESGYRFACLELLEETGCVLLKALQGVFTYRDIDYIGSFECDDEKVTKIWNTAAYTAHLNMQEYLWDGIKRDRLVWIGDMHTEVMTILTAFGYQDVIPKSLDLVRDETPITEEDMRWMNGISSYSIWWLMIHYDLYRHFGNMEYLTQQKDYLSKLLSVLATAVDEDGNEKMPEWRFIDWANHGNPGAEHAGLTALQKMALELGAELLDLLGDKELAVRCRGTAKALGLHVPDTCGSKQAACLLALSGIADSKKINKENISPGGAHGYSTFFGYYLLAAKAMAGDVTGAIADMKEFWGSMLDMGATTFWEHFDLDWMKNATPITDVVPEGKIDIHGDHGTNCYTNFRHSLCHGWASGPCPWLTNYVLGLQTLAPNRVSFKPDLGSLNWAKGTYPTPYGKITVMVNKNADGTVSASIDAPSEVEIVR